MSDDVKALQERWDAVYPKREHDFDMRRALMIILSRYSEDDFASNIFFKLECKWAFIPQEFIPETHEGAENIISKLTTSIEQKKDALIAILSEAESSGVYDDLMKKHWYIDDERSTLFDRSWYHNYD